jgi:hypothetical protein
MVGLFAGAVELRGRRRLSGENSTNRKTYLRQPPLSPSVSPKGMIMDTARWISLAVAAAFCLFAAWLQPWYLLYSAIAYMLLPLTVIWYGDEMAAYDEWQTHVPTPAIIVKILAWILFALTPLAVYTFKLRLELTVIR